MHSLKKITYFKILIFIIAIFIQSCGFRPVLAKDSAGKTAISEINIVSVTGRDHQRNEKIILKLFDNSNKINSKYSLKLNYDYSSSSLGVMKDGQITRYRLNANINYTLVDNETGKEVSTGSIALSGSYDSSNSDFANFVAERTISDQLLEELIRELKIRLSFAIINFEEDNENSN